MPGNKPMTYVLVDENAVEEPLNKFCYTNGIDVSELVEASIRYLLKNLTVDDIKSYIRKLSGRWDQTIELHR